MANGENTSKEKVIIRRREGSEDSRIINGEKKEDIQTDLKGKKEEEEKKREFEKNVKEKIRLFQESRNK